MINNRNTMILVCTIKLNSVLFKLLNWDAKVLIMLPSTMPELQAGQLSF